MKDDEPASAVKPADTADDPLTSPRRYVKKHGPALVRRAGEYAEAGDEGGFQEMLHRLRIFPGTPRFEEAMEGFRDYAREHQR